MYFWLKHIPPMADEITYYVRMDNENSFTWFNIDEKNSDYQQFLKWLTEGNEPEEWTDGN